MPLYYWSFSVYCACCLAKHPLQQTFPNRDTQPHFYVNVADIDILETELSYIACKYNSVDPKAADMSQPLRAAPIAADQIF